MSRLSACLAALALSAPLPAAAVTMSNLATYSFDGVCSDCNQQTGAQVSATLVVQNYVNGDALTTDNFVMFSYGGSDEFAPYAINQAQINTFSGRLSTAPGPYTVSILSYVLPGASAASGIVFNSDTNGTWSTGYGGPISADMGAFHTWNGAAAVASVPEPMTASLLCVGLVGLGVLKRRD